MREDPDRNGSTDDTYRAAGLEPGLASKATAKLVILARIAPSPICLPGIRLPGIQSGSAPQNPPALAAPEPSATIEGAR